MKGQQQEVTQLTFKDKCHKMAETLRNCKDLQPIVGRVHISLNAGHYYCALGALGFRAGMTNDFLDTSPYNHIFDAYGFTEEEKRKTVAIPMKLDYMDPNVENFMYAVFKVFDHYGDYEVTASWLDTLE